MINKNCGIYRIMNSKTGLFYIGSSHNINKRLKNHFYNLNNNKHYNKQLQSDFNIFGFSNFIINILAACPIGYLARLEQWFLTNLKPQYNVINFAYRSDSNYFEILDEKSKKQRREINPDYLYYLDNENNLDEIERVLLFEQVKENNWKDFCSAVINENLFIENNIICINIKKSICLTRDRVEYYCRKYNLISGLILSKIHELERKRIKTLLLNKNEYMEANIL